MDYQRTETSRIPVFSRYHPIIPKKYTPAWKLDMKNRQLIVENCKLSSLPYGPHETSLYLEKRERLSCAEPRDAVNSKTLQVSRDEQLKPLFHSPMSKFQSSCFFRFSSS